MLDIGYGPPRRRRHWLIPALLIAAILTLISMLPGHAQQSVGVQSGEVLRASTGQAFQLSMTIYHTNGQLIPERQHSWWSEDPAVATVSPGGLVTTLAPGFVALRVSARSQTLAVYVHVSLPDSVPVPPDTLPPEPPDTIILPEDTLPPPPVPVPVVVALRLVPATVDAQIGDSIRWRVEALDSIGAVIDLPAGAGMGWVSSDSAVQVDSMGVGVVIGQPSSSPVRVELVSPWPTVAATINVAAQPPPPPPPPVDTLPPPPPPPAGRLWRHMRTSVIDYRIHYQKEPQRSQEYDFAASKYDHVTAGLGNLAPYRARNPNVTIGVYDTFWFIPVNGAGATESWLRNQGCNVEEAYLHVPGAAKDSASRVTQQQFAGRWYWYYDLGDPCWQRWREHETQRLVAGGATTLFYDSNSPTTVNKYVPAVTQEFASRTAYYAAYDSVLRAQAALMPAGYLLPNHAQNFSKAQEMTIARTVTGGVMTEYENTPYGSGVKEWNNIDALVAGGAVVQFSTGVSPGSKNDARYGATPGNYSSVAERVLMWEYASYLMVVDPKRMDAVYFETYGLNWSRPFSETWLAAFEVDIGLARAPRSVAFSGTDGAGQTYQVFARQLERASVYIRPQGGKTASGSFDYSDASAVVVPIACKLLRADGSVAPLPSVQLRVGEAVVCMH